MDDGVGGVADGRSSLASQEVLQAIGPVFAHIEETLRSKQWRRHRDKQEHTLRNYMAEVDGQLLVTNESEETARRVTGTELRIKWIEGAIMQAMNERSRKARSVMSMTEKGHIFKSFQ